MRAKLLLLFLISLAAGVGGHVEILRDRWGAAHIYAGDEMAGFYGAGWACAQDRILQMDLFRRRAAGRLAELFGEAQLNSDRKFRMAGMARHCREAFGALPPYMRDWLRAYAAGVNAWMRANPETVRRRFASLGTVPDPWTPADSLLAFMATADLFDKLYDEQPVQAYRELRKLAAEVGEAEALRMRGMVLDDEAAIVPETEMAKDREAYRRLKARAPVLGFVFRPSGTGEPRFSHAWTVSGARSTTGKPILESDPQVPVTNPPWWYEYHLSAGTFDVRGISLPGSPGMMIGFNRHIAWGITALGAGSTVTFLEKLAPGGYLYRGQTISFERRLEEIHVKGATPVIQEVLTNQHGFVFNALASNVPSGAAYVSHYKQAMDRGSSVRAMLERMRARDWKELAAAHEHYYVPGAHLIFSDVRGNIGYWTVAHIPLTRRSRRIALEGWTGEDEVLGRIPFDEMPHMLNPAEGFISHANNLPVGSWYPYDLGLNTGGGGSRAWRLRQLLAGNRRFSMDDFETLLHRDDTQAAVAVLLPIARKVAEEDKVTDPAASRVLEATRDWDLRFRSSHPAYWLAKRLVKAYEVSFRRAGLGPRFGNGDAGVCHLARRISQPFSKNGATPKDSAVRAFLTEWLKEAGNAAAQESSAVHVMPYQANERLGLPGLDEKLTLRSPPLSCEETSTIWSQHGNSYTQIVDLSDVDNSRSVLPPGNSEDPQSPFYASQVDIWVKGSSHPAPLSRKKVEAVTVSRETLRSKPYQGPTAQPERVAGKIPDGARFIPALR
jgi:penicillin amidase